MTHEDKTKKQLIDELEELRGRVADLEALQKAHDELERRVKERTAELKEANERLQREIEERKRAEETLKESEALHRATLEATADGLLVVDKEGNALVWNNRFAKIWKIPENLLETRSDEKLLNYFLDQIKEPQAFLSKVQQLYKSSKESFDTLYFKDGRVFERYSSQLIRDGKIAGRVWSFSDVTARKRMEDLLRESEEKYRLLVENANEAIFIAQDGVIKFPNPAILSITGYSEEELSKISFMDLIHPEDRDFVLDRYKKRLKGEKVPSLYSFRSINRDGEEVWNQITSVLISWEGRPAALCIIRDITQIKKLETQFQQVQKMEAIGTLAGGIAHDFNNLLMGIQGYASLIMLDTDPTHPHYEKLRRIEEQVRSGAELTKQLLGFARGGKYEIKPTNLNEMVEMTSTMFGRTKKEIKIHRRYQKGIWTVEVDQSQIDQVLLNLYVNAWQAMPGGGDLYLETENVTLDENYTKPYNMEPGHYVKISVTDTGVGMDEASQQRIFEPFFTTKEMGRGTGLGLASVYGIVKSHGGILNIYSEKGEGSTFNIFLPALKKKIVREKKVLDKVFKGTETILLVDDEENILDVAAQLLKTLGYTVLEARSGNEAIEVYKKNKEKIDMVILDMIMPGIGGGEVYDRIKVINPDAKVLLSSGYSIDGQATEIMERGCDGFIQKPFNMKELSQKMREILDIK